MAASRSPRRDTGGQGDGEDASTTLPRQLRRNWYHRNPCHRCAVCTSHACFVHNPGGGRLEVHICWRGCDGLPPALLAWAS
jgi:hypothetical protein